jgi:hypothetical protein
MKNIRGDKANPSLSESVSDPVSEGGNVLNKDSTQRGMRPAPQEPGAAGQELRADPPVTSDSVPLPVTDRVHLQTNAPALRTQLVQSARPLTKDNRPVTRATIRRVNHRSRAR